MITITNKAASKIQELLNGRGSGNGIRIGVVTTGCSGYAYQLEWADKVEADDVIWRDKDIDIIINPKWTNVLWGTEIDYKREGLNEGFEFTNPNEKARCGCGESFSI